MTVGDTIGIGTGSSAETRKIASLGTAASNHTTLWQPLPDGPVITIPAGSTNVPVTSTAGFVVGQKIALGYGATYPAVARDMEQYEVATVTAVGKPGTQAYLAADAPAGATNIKVTSVADISAGDKIRLDIDSVGHGIETVTVTSVGTEATPDQSHGGCERRRDPYQGPQRRSGFAVGDKITVGTPANKETVTVTAVGSAGPARRQHRLYAGPRQGPHRRRVGGRSGHGPRPGRSAQVQPCGQPSLQRSGNGHQLRAGDGLCPFEQRARSGAWHRHHARQPLAKDHAINAVVRDAAVTTAGYQGTPAPNQWFGGPELTTRFRSSAAPSPSRGQHGAARRLRPGCRQPQLRRPRRPMGRRGLPGRLRTEQSGCYVPAPGAAGGFGPSVRRRRDQYQRGPLP